MEQVQRYFIKFNPETLEILSMGINVVGDDNITLPVEWKLIEPFFTLDRVPSLYYPIVEDSAVTGFRRKEMYEASVIVNTDGDYVRSLRQNENTITIAKLILGKTADKISLAYDMGYADRLELIKDRVYNIYITSRGNPFNILAKHSITLAPLAEGQVIVLDSVGHTDISVYIIADETKDK